MFSLTRRFTRTTTANVSSTSSSALAGTVENLFLFSSLRHQSDASSSSSPSNQIEINDVANCFRMAQSNRIPLGKVIHGVPPGTKSKIFKSGKGLEGYLRQFPSAFAVEKVGNDKFLLLVDERLREVGNGGGENENKGTSDGKSPPVVSAPGDISGMVVQRIRPPLSEKSLRRQEFRKKQMERGDRKLAQREVGVTLKEGGGGTTAAGSSSGGSQMWVDEILQQEQDAKNKKQGQDGSSNNNNVDNSNSNLPPQQQDSGDQNPELTARCKSCLSGENQWYKIQAIHAALYKGTAVQLSPFVQFLINAPKHFWVDAKNGFVCKRLPYHTQAPPNLALRTIAPNSGSSGGGVKAPSSEWGDPKLAPTAQDVYEILRYIPIHWAEFGSIQIPDAARKKHIRISSKLTWFARQPRFFDLRFIGGTIEIRRSPVLHPTDHGMSKAEAEQLVQHRIDEDAKLGQPLVLLQARGIQPTGIASTPATSSNASNNNNASASSGGAAASATSSSSSSFTPPQQPSSSSPPASSTATTSASSSNVDAVTKALVRIAPGHFIPAESIMRRATKKMSDQDLAFAAERVPLMVERLVVQSKTNPKHSLSLYRRKLGIDDSQWKPEFIKELEDSPNLKLLGSLMTHMCAQWDRTHFLYVRLPDVDKVESGGFDEMVNFLRLHPQTFRTGEYFVKRNDLSDPTGADADPEPTSKIVLTTKQLEDNPYHQLIDLANVFHYLIPDGESVSLSHFVDSSSPAMRSVLPPRILTILQAYPEKFNCREIAPGTYTVSRIRSSSSAATSSSMNTNNINSNNSAASSVLGEAASGSAYTSKNATSNSDNNNNSNQASATTNETGEYEDDEDGANNANEHNSDEVNQVASMTKEEAVAKLIAIVPLRGVDIAHVEATMPQTLRRGIVRLFGAGGVANLVAENLDRFHVVKNPPYQTIFVRQQKQ